MKTLYLGTDPSHYKCEGQLVHFPVIKTIPRDGSEIRKAFADMPLYTHLIFSSKNAVEIFFSKYPQPIRHKIIAAIGKVTAHTLMRRGYQPEFIPEEETQEGLIDLLKVQELRNSYFFLPRSSLSRPALVHFFQFRAIKYRAVDLYDTEHVKPDFTVNLEEFHQIVFTSPSTVIAFFKLFTTVPKHIKLLPIGPITQKKLEELAPVSN
ncbi:MAG TPA: uroporphyrinogen-III synthase [Rhabdochlamydiaceae bacterium]|nr:uroporphyrinogen-III synthase [Rhabdochlamydiaceae bacterium]